MKGTTHLAAGLATGLAIARLHGASLEETALITGVAAIAALAPDWLQINAPGLNKTIRGAFGHRGLSHWLLTAWGVSLAVDNIQPASLAGYPLSLAALAGWISHILLDSLNDPGVPAFWPLPIRLHLSSFKTGEFADGVICWAAIAATLWGVIDML